ncbi:uncharacterized protein LOC6569109 [Drosophila grimshawi]|uniref:GH23048 n=1 Tax=Drosophila grimshawi TaxID=7222 RepID=B4JWI7_DROGR|nr:uncharacterized protein LOC6569109 [Drosophila grimshawi]EDV98325.1 GH23048 [Drosophila grimshawi]
MSVKSPLKFGWAHLTIAYRNRPMPNTCLGLHMIRRVMASSSQFPSREEHPKWKLHVDILSPKEKAKSRELVLPMLTRLSFPWQAINIKWDLWKLKWFWDWKFNESLFVDSSKQALVLATRFIAQQREEYIKCCTTQMGYKQILHDLIGPTKQESSAKCWPCQLMRFEHRHIYRAMPLKVHRLTQYDRKFAFIDMLFLASRRGNDFATKQELCEMEILIEDHLLNVDKVLVPNPIVFAKIFVRFRRDYSLPANLRSSHWLISSFKILELDVHNSYQ